MKDDESAFAILERSEAAAPDADYLIDATRTWTYRELVNLSTRAAGALLELGLRRGDRVLLATRDRVEAVATLWGAWRAGLVVVPVPPVWSAEELRSALADSDARAVVADPGVATRIAPWVRSKIALLGLDGAGEISWQQAVRRAAPGPRAEASSGEVALWLYTSGSTGAPRALLHSHGGLVAASRGLLAAIGLGPGDRVLSVAKMFFAYGLGCSVHLPAAAGAAVVLHEGPSSAPAIVGCLERARPTVLCAVPSALRALLSTPGAVLPPSVRAVLSAGEALAPDLAAEFHARFGLAPLDGFGCTEALHHVTCSRPGDLAPGSAGTALEGRQLSIRGDDGSELAEGEPGALWISTPSLAIAAREAGITAPLPTRGGWWPTGDIARLQGGRLFLLGRSDDMMKANGYRIFPGEIEAVIRQHPGVRDAAVVLRPVPAGAPELTAFVVLAGPLEDMDAVLGAHCAASLAPYKIPEVFVTTAELPRTITGKLRRAPLRGPTQP